MLKQIKNNKAELAWLLLVLLVAAFFRFYRLEELFQFSFDEEVWGYRIQRIIAYRDWLLIGNEISSTKIFTGPAFVYFHVPFLIFSKLNPLIGGYLWSSIGVVTTFLVYWFSKRFTSTRVALIAGILYAGSFAMALYDRRYWNVTPIPIVSLVSVWLFLEGLKGKKNAFLWAVLVLTFGVHSHFSAIVVAIALVVTFWWQNRNQKSEIREQRTDIRKPIKRKFLVAAVVFVVLNTLPQVVFDLRHDFWHAKALKNLIISVGQPKKAESNANIKGIFMRFSESMGSLIYLGKNIDVADEMSHCGEIVETRPKSPMGFQIVGVGLIFGIAIYSLKNRGQPLSQIMLVMLAVNVLGLFVYRERVFAYHFAPLMPFIFIYAGKFLDTMARKMGRIPIGFLIVGYIAINFYSLRSVESDMSFVTKRKIVEAIISETKDKQIQVDVLDSCERYGMRYLFTALGKPVARSWVDSDLAYLYPEELREDIEVKVSIAVSDEGITESYINDYERLIETAYKSLNIGKAVIFFEQVD